jgi:anaerobic selenocysteine-containing dehydrogenase
MELRTICNRDCPDACGIVATVEDGRVTRLAGDPDHPVTRGFLCYRTSHFLARQYAPDRLTTPLLRGKDGALRPIAWDDALDLVAERLTTIRRESGPPAIFHYRSGGTLGILTALTDYFFARFGPCTSKRGDICSGAGDAAQLLDFGDEESHDLFDLLASRRIILWGKNPVVSGPHLLPVLRDARARGARLTLVDPVRHKTASLVDAYWQPRPAGDFALAMATARLLFERGHTDPDAARYCDGFDGFRALAMRHSVDGWCRDADVPAAAAEDLAAALADRPCAILVGWGMARRTVGAAIVRALDALGAVSGNLGIAGGGVSYYFKRRGAFDTSFVSAAGAPPRTVCEPLFGGDVLALRDPPIRAVWVTCGNPVAMLPESETVARALATREFVVVTDSFLTDTARLAHLVLPTTTLLEADDLVGAYGHHWIGAARPVVAPEGGARSDLEILQGLAARVGLGEAMAGDARSWKRRVIRPEAVAAGATLEALEERPVRNPIVGKVLFADRRFPTESGRVQLIQEAPAAISEDGDEDYPLSLLSLSTERSQSSQWARPLDGPLPATVHPDAVPGIPDGATARLASRIGSIVVRVRHDSQQRRDVVIVPKGGHHHDGRCANALVRARTTDLGEGGALYDERVRIET